MLFGDFNVQAVIELVDCLVVLLIELVLFFKRHVTHLVILLDQRLHLFVQSFAGIVQQGFELRDDGLLLLQVFALVAMHIGVCSVARFEEFVASRLEIFPQFVAHFLGHGADGLPFFLQGDDFLCGFLPFGAVLQGHHLFDKSLLLGNVLVGLLL